MLLSRAFWRSRGYRWQVGRKTGIRAAVWVSAVLSSCKVNLALKREALDCKSKAIHPQKYCVCLPPCTGREGSDWALEGP